MRHLNIRGNIWLPLMNHTCASHCGNDVSLLLFYFLEDCKRCESVLWVMLQQKKNSFTSKKVSLRKYRTNNLHFNVLKSKEAYLKKQQHQKTLAHLWPAAGGPVGWAGDVCVAGWYGLRLGHVFTVLGPQGFLLLHTHSLDAENCPFSLSWAPAARRAFLPLADPPANTKTHKMTLI